MNLSILRSAEKATVSGFLHDLYDPETFPDFGRRLVEITSHYFHDFAHVVVFDIVNQTTGTYAAVSNCPGEFNRVFPVLGEYIHQNPSWSYAAAGGTDRVLMITDFLSERQWMATDMYQLGFKEMNVRHQLAVSLSRPGYISGLTLNGDCAAGVEARVVMHMIAPHIIRAHDVALRGRSPVLLFDSFDPTTIGLSEREVEILRWVADSMSDAEIAPLLGTSASMVGKHVERICEKLHVFTRAGAVARAQELLRD